MGFDVAKAPENNEELIVLLEEMLAILTPSARMPAMTLKANITTKAIKNPFVGVK